jgi:subtilisin family serine protease
LNVRYFVCGILATALLSLSAVHTPAAAGTDDESWEPAELVCALNPGGVIDSINARYGTTLAGSVDSGAIYGVSYLLATPENVSEDSLALVISADPDVAYCSPNYLLDAPEPVQRSQPFLDVKSVGEVLAQPAVQQLQLAAVQTQATGVGVKVAVIDVGVDATQPMLSGVVLTGYDYVSQDSVANDEPGGLASGHGTFVAGVVHLVAPAAQIVPYRVVDTLGRGNGYHMAEAVYSAVARGCKVINISLVMQGKHHTLEDAIEFAREHDVLVVAAAGNDSADTSLFPANDSHVLGVAAVDSADHKSGFSNFGSDIDLSAPGTNIRGPFPDSTYARWNGTSFAAPFVAGAGALLYSVRPTAPWGDIVDDLTRTAVHIDLLNPAYAGKLGSGRVNPLSAVSAWAPAAGDVNGSGQITSSDIIYLINYLFKSGPPPVTLNAADADGSCAIAAADVIYLVNYVFKGAAPPLPGCVP